MYTPQQLTTMRNDINERMLHAAEQTTDDYQGGGYHDIEWGRIQENLAEEIFTRYTIPSVHTVYYILMNWAGTHPDLYEHVCEILNHSTRPEQRLDHLASRLEDESDADIWYYTEWDE